MSGQPPDSLNVPLKGLIALAIEHWRLSAWLAEAGDEVDASTGRHALRRINDFLSTCEIQTRDMTGAAFDPGLAMRVVDTIEDPSMRPGAAVVDETVSPLVSWRGIVVRDAEVVTRGCAAK